MPSRLLLIDTDFSRRARLKSELSKEYFNIESVNTVSELFTNLQRNTPDLILMADQITDRSETINGYDLCDRIKTRLGQAFVPVIMMSPSHHVNWVRAMACGVDDVVTAQPTLSHLVPRLRQFIRTKANLDALNLHFKTTGAEGFAEPVHSFRHRLNPRGEILITGNDATLCRQFTTRLGNTFKGGLKTVSPENLSDFGAVPNAVIIVEDGPLGADHYALLSKLQNNTATETAPILCLCASTDSNSFQQAISLGATDCIDTTGDIPRVSVRLRAMLRADQMAKRMRNAMNDRLRESITDQLTGLHNRRYAERYLRKIAGLDPAQRNPFALMMLDLDNFKSLNDHYGHRTGDRILKKIGALLRDNLRVKDLVSRIGGDEFLIVLPDIDEPVAAKLAHRLVEVVADEVFIAPSEIPVTISIGMAAARGDHVNIETLWASADRALYAAKNEGRNMVKVIQLAA